MAKIGQLVLAGGRWNDRQVVSKAWIDASTTPRTEASINYSYGYLWWLGRSPFNGREVHWPAGLPGERLVGLRYAPIATKSRGAAK
jgi:CubicO group peptidase (beta-lactamase class C family)